MKFLIKYIKNYLLNMIKDNTFNNKIIKISILKDLNKKFDKYSEDNPELYTYNCDDCDEIIFKIINKCKLSTINKILNKYKSDIWTNNNYFCLVKVILHIYLVMMLMMLMFLIEIEKTV